MSCLSPRFCWMKDFWRCRKYGAIIKLGQHLSTVSEIADESSLNLLKQQSSRTRHFGSKWLMTFRGLRTVFLLPWETSIATAVNIKDLVRVFPGLLVNTFMEKVMFSVNERTTFYLQQRLALWQSFSLTRVETMPANMAVLTLSCSQTKLLKLQSTRTKTWLYYDWIESSGS